MATQPAKKQKVSRPPVIFKSPGLKPDVRFKIFNEYEFHAHSVILKLGSAFFRKFLGPANKKESASAITTGNQQAAVSLSISGHSFQYEWASQVDADGGGWHLIRALGTEINRIPDHLNEGLEIKAVTNLLRSLYRENLTIDDAVDLTMLTEMADYYCALKPVSHSLDATFLKCFYFDDLDQLRRDAADLIPCAAKLRNEILFRDLVILLAGEWTDGEYDSMEKKCKDIIDRVHDRLSGVLFRIHLRMEQELIAPIGYEDQAGYMRDFMEETKANLRVQKGGDWPTSLLPLYYRKLRNGPYGLDEELEDFEDYLGSVLRNRLVLNQNAISGEGTHENCFFAPEVRDSDLPWDVTDLGADW